LISICKLIQWWHQPGCKINTESST